MAVAESAVLGMVLARLLIHDDTSLVQLGEISFLV